MPAEGELWLTEAAPIPTIPATAVTRTAMLAQMVAETITAGGHEVDFVILADEDAPNMRALAALTKPGPFASLTHRLGGFIGVKRGGRLVAMAGERMRLDGFTEVSGVCTHPEHRGQGLAGALMRIVASGCWPARNAVPAQLRRQRNRDRALREPGLRSGPC